MLPQTESLDFAAVLFYFYEMMQETSELLLRLTFIAMALGAVAGALIGAYVASRKVYDLSLFLKPDRVRLLQGATIGVIFGLFVGPKLMLIGYVFFVLLG